LDELLFVFPINKKCFYTLELLKQCIIFFGDFWGVRAFSCCYLQPLLATAGILKTASWKLHLLRGGSN
jgi:hypothetical protein